MEKRIRTLRKRSCDTKGKEFEDLGFMFQKNA